MILKYRNYEYPSIILSDSGYFEPMLVLNDEDRKVINTYGNIVLPPFSEPYFHEADILTKINNNVENYFDFNKSIIDIGAHIGCYSFRSLFKYIYAFEPNKYIYHILCCNLMIHNKFDISEVYNVILSDKIEEIEFDGFHSKLIDQNNEIYNDIYPNQNSRYISNVKTHILDEYNCTNIGLIKVDVEGMEEKVLRGGIGTIIRNNYPPILFELWDVGYLGMTQEKHDSLENFLKKLGYTIYWNWGDDQTHLAMHNK